MKNEIKIGKHNYILSENEMGNNVIKRYDEESKMWIKVTFNEHKESKLKNVQELLANEFISKRAAQN